MNAEARLNDLEAKLSSYHNTPFTKICLVMKADNADAQPKSIVLNYTASSLYSVIADGAYRATNASRAKWMSLIDNSSLQPHCNMEGFNMQFPGVRLFLRIGLVGNNEEDCTTPDSWIGFGVGTRDFRRSSGKGDKFTKMEIKTFGQILVQ